MRPEWVYALKDALPVEGKTDTYRWRHRGAAEGPHWPLRHFRPHEFEDPLTGVLVLHLPSVDRLERVRDRLAAPLLVTSGYRSPEYNRRVGGATGSMHLVGRAFDLKVRDSTRHMDIAQAALAEGFTGFGFYKTFVHIDTGPWRSWVD